MMNMSTIAILGTGTITPFGEQDAALPAILPAELPVRCDTAGLDRFVPKRALRRMDHFSRMALYASCLAMEDAGVWGETIEDLGMAVASGYGAAQTTFTFLDSFLDSTDRLASPTHFSSGLHNAAPAYISMLLGAQGPSVSISNIGHGPAHALNTAAYWLHKGHAQYVLVGGVDEHCSVLQHCYTRFQQVGDAAPLIPESRPGEGAAFMLLGKADAASRCRISKLAIGPREQHADAGSVPLMIAPLGLAAHDDAYTRYAQGRECVSTLSTLGSHPSALAFAVVQAARLVRGGQTERAEAMTLGPDGNAAHVELCR